jgi:hypothetical protein
LVDIKEIKNIELAPFIKMSSSITAILAFITAVVLLIILTVLELAAMVPQYGLFRIIAGFGVSFIIIYPIIAFFITISVSFLTIVLYNTLSSKIGGIELELDGSQVTGIPIVPFALIMASIEAIWAFIIGLFLATLIIPISTLTSGIIPVLTNEFSTVFNTSSLSFPTGPTGVTAGTEGIILDVSLIIGLPIFVFVFGFIGQSIIAILYNYLATKVSRIKIEFTTIAGNLNELKSISALPTALAVATIFAITGFINGLYLLVGYMMAGSAISGIIYPIKDPVGNFVEYFIVVALIALIYNFMAPRIGGIKLMLK